MSLQEIKDRVSRLSPTELATFASWFEEFLVEEWDRQIEVDSRAGRLDVVVQNAQAQIEAGQITPR